MLYVYSFTKFGKNIKVAMVTRCTKYSQNAQRELKQNVVCDHLQVCTFPPREQRKCERKVVLLLQREFLLLFSFGFRRE